MDPKYGKFLANPHARAAEAAKAEVTETAAGGGSPPAATPQAAVQLKLEGDGEKWIGRCPACAAAGRDEKGQHLVVFADGRFGCVVNPGEAGHDHRSEMARLRPELIGGQGGHRTPRIDLSEERKAIEAGWAALWQQIKKELGGGVETLGPSAPIPTDPFGQFETFCGCFQPGDTAWVGGRFDLNEEKWAVRGERKSRRQVLRFRDNLFCPADPASRAAAWARISELRLDHASGLGWSPEAQGRSDEYVIGRRFVVVEHDKDNGVPTSLEAQVAAIKYARDVLGMDLIYVVNTGRGNLHGVFDASGISPNDHKILSAIGCDTGALDHARTRTPGVRRRADAKGPGGGLQGIEWIKPEAKI